MEAVARQTLQEGKSVCIDRTNFDAQYVRSPSLSMTPSCSQTFLLAHTIFCLHFTTITFFLSVLQFLELDVLSVNGALTIRAKKATGDMDQTLSRVPEYESMGCRI